MRSELIPTITAGILELSGWANQFTKGLACSRLETGFTSTPAWSRGVIRHISVDRSRARSTVPGTAIALKANPTRLLDSPQG